MRPTEQIADVADATRAILRSGVLRPERPARMLRMAKSVRKWGPGVASLFALGGARYGDRAALVDECRAVAVTGAAERNEGRDTGTPFADGFRHPQHPGWTFRTQHARAQDRAGRVGDVGNLLGGAHRPMLRAD